MREPDPDRLLARMSARTFQEWLAFDLAFGDISGLYDRETVAQLHELIQLNNQLTGASITKKGKRNPAGKFRKAPRPWVVEEPQDPDDDEDEEDLSEQERIHRFDLEVFGPPESTPPSAGEDGK